MDSDTLQLQIFLDGKWIRSGGFLLRSEMSTLKVRGIVNQISDGKWKIVGPPEEKAGSNEVIVNVTDQTQSSREG